VTLTILSSRVAGLQDPSEVLERLLGLRIEVVDADDVPGLVDRRLAGDDQQPAHLVAERDVERVEEVP
jgi:hypothetical protein